MIELTEREEQEMIERAKAGDPEANYNMSLWALDRAQEDPEDERWNRLAAKCLVRAAEAGYAPARERMQTLLRQTEEPAPAREDRFVAEPDPEPEADPSFDPWAEPEPAAKSESAAAERPGRDVRAGQRPSFLTVAGAAVGVLGHKIASLFSGGGKTPDAPEDVKTEAESAQGKKRSFFRFSEWDDRKWKRVQIICIAVSVVLALLIAVMLITGNRSTKKAEEGSQLPTPEAVETVVPSPTPEPVLYPAQAIRDEITAANLEVFPAEEDYVSAPTTAAVDTASGLNLRRGPGSSYGQIVLMGNDSPLEVYAYKNSWALVKYEGDTWGWCSSQYLK